MLLTKKIFKPEHHSKQSINDILLCACVCIYIYKFSFLTNKKNNKLITRYSENYAKKKKDRWRARYKIFKHDLILKKIIYVTFDYLL